MRGGFQFTSEIWWPSINNIQKKHKSCKEVSSIAIDKAHEQNNAVIKDVRGATDLTEDPTALCWWMIAGPEVSHLVARNEEVAGT